MQFAHSRRRFVRETLLASAALGVGVHQQVPAQPGKPPSARLNLAAIGVWSRGQENLLAVRHVREVRGIARAARASQSITQMGNQHHSSAGYHQARDLVQRGDLGEIHEVHSWTNRPIWPQGISHQQAIPVPPELDWKLWPGPAANSDFQYAAALSETCLLGNGALRAGTTIRWNATEGKTDQPQADVWLGRKYRQGWEW